MKKREGDEGTEIRRMVFASRDLCAVTCGTCGHADTLEAFVERPVTGMLPKDVFQCPKCGVAVERRMGRDRWGWPVCELAECQARM